MKEFWRVAIVISRNNRHQQKFISQTHGYFENQISLAVAIEWGPFQVSLYNRNLFCLQLPFAYKNSIREGGR